MSVGKFLIVTPVRCTVCGRKLVGYGHIAFCWNRAACRVRAARKKAKRD